jgi:hypothetical protein
MSQKMCENGKDCKFLKLGTCKFAHAANPKAKPPHNLVTYHAAQNKYLKSAPRALNTVAWNTVKQSFIPKVVKLQESVRRAAALNDYVKIDSKDQKGKESWADASELNDLTQQLSLLKTAARAALGNSHCVSKIWAGAQSVAGGAGSALSSSVALCPSTSSEWTTFAALYDECLITAIDVNFCINITAGSGSGTFEYAVGFDSTRNSAPTTQADVLESTQHVMGVFGTSLASTCVNNAFRNGYHHFHIKQQRNPVANAVAVTGGNGIIANFPGEWFETNNAASVPYSVGFLRTFCSLLATCAIQIKFNLCFHCEFRERT